ncbi:MAG: hypothetical protein LAT61_09820 [Alcanivorax sp.]|nr:hypothetical protein [Alcanivorax sp.]
MTAKIAWAKKRDLGDVVHILQVSNGKAADCVCLDCGGELVAKHGTGKMAPHFAHSANTECRGEGALHYAAKHLLAEILLQQGLILSSSSGEVSEYIRSERVVFPYQVPDLMLRAHCISTEKDVSDDWRPDLVAVDKNGNSIAFEVAVTHFKSEKDIIKIRRHGMDCVEIDISDIGWDADRAKLTAELHEIKRQKWLHRKSALEAKFEASEKLASRISQLHDIHNKRIRKFIAKGWKDKGVGFLNPAIPSLSARHEARDVFGGIVVGEVVRTPRIVRIDSEWKHGDSGAAVTAVLEKGVKINLSIVDEMVFYQDEDSCMEGPALVLVVRDSSAGNMDLRGEWYGVERWQAKLDELAKKDAVEKLNIAKERQRGLEDFAAEFRRKKPEEQLSIILRKFGISETYSVGRYDPEWNTSETVWKLIIWHYKVLKKRSVKVVDLANDRWFAKMLGFSQADSRRRCNGLQPWMDLLVRNNILRPGLHGALDIMGKLRGPVPGVPLSD